MGARIIKEQDLIQVRAKVKLKKIKVKSGGKVSRRKPKYNRVTKEMTIKGFDKEQIAKLVKFANSFGFVVNIECGVLVNDKVCRGKLKVIENKTIRCVKCEAKWWLN